MGNLMTPALAKELITFMDLDFKSPTVRIHIPLRMGTHFGCCRTGGVVGFYRGFPKNVLCWGWREDGETFY